MSLASMIAEMRGVVPGYSALLARTHLGEAWLNIRQMRGWSFQLATGGFAVPPPINNGTVTVTPGSALVIADPLAANVWNELSSAQSVITQRQFRIGIGDIYTIATFDGPNGRLTLDRPYVDYNFGANLPYTIYQCYFPAPCLDFEAWESVIDRLNLIPLACGNSLEGRRFADRTDSQRLQVSPPTALLPFGTDQNPKSPTYNYMLYELYPQSPQLNTYGTWYTRLGPDLSPTTSLPFPITEDAIKTLARVKAYEWAEANRDPANPRGQGADFRFLLGEAQKQFAAKMKDIRMVDADRVDMWRSTLVRVSGRADTVSINQFTNEVWASNL